jgi:hypothetical protein
MTQVATRLVDAVEDCLVALVGGQAQPPRPRRLPSGPPGVARRVAAAQGWHSTSSP